MKILKWIFARIVGFFKYLGSDIRNLIFFVLSLPALFTLFLALVFSTKLLDPFLYKDQKDKDSAARALEGDIVYLDQGWQQGYRQKYYFTPQGSHIIPLDMALSLQSSTSDKMIFGEDGTAETKFGFLSYPKSDGQTGSNHNPHGLPIGFVEDLDRNETPMLGINCAACHTANIKVGDKTVRIDGGAALGDFMGLIGDIDAALVSTLDDDIRLESYAVKRRISIPKARQELEVVSAKRQGWQARNKTEFPHGFARVDAFGIIFNQVLGRDLHLDRKGEQGNVRTPIAPASYPVLWDTPFLERVQWTGGSNNLKGADPLARNFGQVLGVFGGVEVTTQNSLPGMCSTPNRANLELYNFWLKSLKSPKWSDAVELDVFDPPDLEQIERGRTIYFGGEDVFGTGDTERGCAACHSVITDEWRNRPNKKTGPEEVCEVPIHIISHDEVGTDRNLIDTGRRTGAKTGPLAGQNSKLVNGKIIGAHEDYMFTLAEVITGSLVGSFLSMSCDGKYSAATIIESANTFGNLYRAGAQHKFDKKVGGAFALAPKDLETAQTNWSNANDVVVGIKGRSDLSELNVKLAIENRALSKTNLEQAKSNITTPHQGIFLPPTDDTLFQIDLKKAENLLVNAEDNIAMFENEGEEDNDDAYLAKINFALAKANLLQSRINQSPLDIEPPKKCPKSPVYNSFGYKARPLNGIWASAPYLHNGSIPTLYDILLPPTNEKGKCEADACRPDKFYVGSTKFDTVKVGYESGQTDMSTLLDTSLNGNSNVGHTYMVDELSEQDRMDLIAYLKTL